VNSLVVAVPLCVGVTVCEWGSIPGANQMKPFGCAVRNMAHASLKPQ